MTRVDDLRRQAIRAFQDLLGTKEPKRTIIPALLGDVQGTYEVPGREAFSYVRPYHLDQERLAAYNGGLIRNGAAIPVLVEITTQLGQAPVATIVGRDYHGTPSWDEGSFPYYVAKHASTHEATPGSGDDVVNVYKRAITELRADQQATPNMTVKVQAGLWYYGIAQRYFSGGNSPTIVAPATGYRWDLVYLTNGNALAVKTGTAAAVPSLAVRPNPNVDTLPVAYIYLNSTTSAITDGLIYDARQLADRVLSSAAATVEVQEDDVKVADADVVNFEGGGGRVTDEGGGKVTVDITPGAGGAGLQVFRSDRDGDLDYDAYTSAAWNGDSFSTGFGTINWNTAFGVPADTKAVFLWIMCRDSDVNAPVDGGSIQLKAKSTTSDWSLGVSSKPNDIWDDVAGWIPVAADGTSYYGITASGVNTCEIYVKVVLYAT